MNSRVIAAALSLGLYDPGRQPMGLPYAASSGKLSRSGHQSARHRSDRVTQTNNL